MKTEQYQKRQTATATDKCFRIGRPTAYFILLLLTYTVGYLSASSSTSHPPSPSFTSAVTATNYSSPPSSSSSNQLLDPFRVTTRCVDPIPSELVRQTLLDRFFNGSTPFQDFPADHAAKLLRPTIVKGWGSNGAVFENLIPKVKPRTIIEVGTFLGASALHMAELTRKLGLQTQIICIYDFCGWAGFGDRFENLPMINGDVLLRYQFMQNVVTSNKTGSIIPVPYSSGSALIELCELGVFADLVEIDAGHDFLSAWSDINRGYRILRPGGVLFGHDYFTAADNRGVRRAVDLFARVNGLKVKVDGQHWVIDSVELYYDSS
ncbi:hypothetical protein L6164_004082 [Bauhinia variegata]|uniref:Uncharacterized protein n=1 Tax=Bauhinia variegata TaxID=167791 RepID=A0ACB9Q3I7_BAUVA|nr:hypothetical protein L6164_004082 [Bauhinia variegata]